MRNALALSHWMAQHCNRVQTLAADVMSQTDTLVFVFLSVMSCGFRRSLFILCLPLHMAVSPCHLTRLPSSHSVYFYECLQYLMEAKKAQQSLESTYKQLDSVSLKEAFVILDVS